MLIQYPAEANLRYHFIDNRVDWTDVLTGSTKIKAPPKIKSWTGWIKVQIPKNMAHQIPLFLCRRIESLLRILKCWNPEVELKESVLEWID